MGRYYWGDIEGKFAFGIQSSYDPEEFGTKALGLHMWECGCDSEYKVRPETCNCDEPEDNTQNTEPSTLKFVFYKDQLEDIKEKLDTLLNSFPNELKEKFFTYMETCESYSDQKLSQIFNITISEVRHYLENYFRYILGKKIYNYLLDNKCCIFYGEV
jgi:hypothetical protein